MQPAPTEPPTEEAGARRRLSASSSGCDSGFLERGVQSFGSGEEYLCAVVEDIADWLGGLFSKEICPEALFDELDSGDLLAALAARIHAAASESSSSSSSSPYSTKIGSTRLRHPPPPPPKCRVGAAAGSFFARDNVAQFIAWCRRLGLADCVLFETEDLAGRKNPRHVSLCLMELARIGAAFGLPAPQLVRFEREIDAEMAADADSGLASPTQQRRRATPPSQSPPTRSPSPPPAPVLTKTAVTAEARRARPWQCDLKSLDQLVREMVSECGCDEMFPMKRLSEGKYLFGDSQMLIFVRVLRNHVMVRVGGGWDSLQQLLLKHDPCRKQQQQQQQQRGAADRKPRRPAGRKMSAPALCATDLAALAAKQQQQPPQQQQQQPFNVRLPRRQSVQLQLSPSARAGRAQLLASVGRSASSLQLDAESPTSSSSSFDVVGGGGGAGGRRQSRIPVPARQLAANRR